MINLPLDSLLVRIMLRCGFGTPRDEMTGRVIGFRFLR